MAGPPTPRTTMKTRAMPGGPPPLGGVPKKASPGPRPKGQKMGGGKTAMGAEMTARKTAADCQGLPPAPRMVAASRSQPPAVGEQPFPPPPGRGPEGRGEKGIRPEGGCG